MLLYIWGAGHYLQQVIDEIDQTKVKIEAILDRDEKKWGVKLFPEIPIVSPLEIKDKKYDYLIISVKDYEIIERECKNLGIAEEKIVAYWKNDFRKDIFKNRAERIEEFLKEKRQFQIRLDSAPYEWGIKEVPEIKSGAELLKKIIEDHSSLCRFGDGEFEILRGKERPWFQEPVEELSKRLEEVLHSEDTNINIAVAQNFIYLDRYKEAAADSIRDYMFGDTRKYILGVMDEKRTYYDAYVTRPYIIYKDKKNADEIFPLLKKVWSKRDVIIVEGEYSRIGVGNDLLSGASSVARILCPFRNAWDKYDQILNTVLERATKKSLICISLGPCATVLAYDLAKEGYQALDIGQLDNEYEWYLQGVQERVEISGKMVAELTNMQKFELSEEVEYVDQIISKVI